MTRLPIYCLCMLAAFLAYETSDGGPVPVMVPFSQTPMADRHGQEWNIDQNGNIQRSDNSPSLISNAAVLMMGSQQFYCQQPTISSDGTTLEMAGPKPYNGLAVTRHLQILEKEGGVAYADVFSNVTGREVQTIVEFRYHFSGKIKQLVTNTGRISPLSLDPDDEGIFIEPTQNDSNLPAVVLSLTDGRLQTPPKMSLRNGYQLSISHTLSIPPGGSSTIIHAVGQTRLDAAGEVDAFAQNFRTWRLKRIARMLPKRWTESAVNLIVESPLNTLKEWFPSKHWGIGRDASDILALGDETRLRGRAMIRGLQLEHTLGKLMIEWDQVVAIAGPSYLSTDQPMIWLADGQILKGTLTANEPKFEMLSGTSMPLDFDKMDRLVRGTTHGPPEGIPDPAPEGLIELWSGERISISPDMEWKTLSRWGPLAIPWRSVITWDHSDGIELAPMLVLRDGSRIRTIAQGSPALFQTRLFGTQSLNPTETRRAIHPTAILAEVGNNLEPAESFLELAGDQRVVAHVTDTSLTIATGGGPITISPNEIREILDTTDDRDESPLGELRWHQVELWGGSSIVGQLQNPVLTVEGQGFSWTIPVREIRRLVNPVPRIETNVMHRVAELIQHLGHADWKTREDASAELAELGPLARASLSQAMRQSTDPEVIRRLQALLTTDE